MIIAAMKTPIFDFASPALAQIQGHAPLTHLSLIRAKGADAARFLHGQLSSDILSLDQHTVRLAGFCSAKGRLQASFWVLRLAEDDIALICAADVAEAVCKRLQMFVLRAKCQLSWGVDVPLVGLWGADATALLNGLAPLQHAEQALGAYFMRLPDVHGVARGVWVGGDQAFSALLPPSPLEVWRWLDVQSGVPMIEAATADQFVPQMVNFELLGGVNFQKGCYPGQEVVARSQYRGVIKRRMFLFHGDQAMYAGQEVFHSADPAQPAGMVVNAAPCPLQAAAPGISHSALIEIKLLEVGSVHLGSVSGALMQQGVLPYEVSVLKDAEPAPKVG